MRCLRRQSVHRCSLETAEKLSGVLVLPYVADLAGSHRDHVDEADLQGLAVQDDPAASLDDDAVGTRAQNPVGNNLDRVEGADHGLEKTHNLRDPVEVPAEGQLLRTEPRNVALRGRG